jgi:hypothetical protein
MTSECRGRDPGETYALPLIPLEASQHCRMGSRGWRGRRGHLYKNGEKEECGNLVETEREALRKPSRLMAIRRSDRIEKFGPLHKLIRTFYSLSGNDLASGRVVDGPFPTLLPQDEIHLHLLIYHLHLFQALHHATGMMFVRNAFPRIGQLRGFLVQCLHERNRGESTRQSTMRHGSRTCVFFFTLESFADGYSEFQAHLGGLEGESGFRK